MGGRRVWWGGRLCKPKKFSTPIGSSWGGEYPPTSKNHFLCMQRERHLRASTSKCVQRKHFYDRHTNTVFRCVCEANGPIFCVFFLSLFWKRPILASCFFSPKLKILNDPFPPVNHNRIIYSARSTESHSIRESVGDVEVWTM